MNSGAQIICIGDSQTYGVGSTVGGWPDLLKHEMHRVMYKEGGPGHISEIYNLAIPSRTVEQTAQHILVEVAARVDKNAVNIVFISLGTNDSRAKDTADAFVTTAENYQSQMLNLLSALTPQVQKVIAYGLTPVNETLTSPKRSHDGSVSYFTNERIKQFEQAFAAAAGQAGISFIPLYELALNSNWPQNLYADGLHMNANGQQWLYDQIRPYVQEFLS